VLPEGACGRGLVARGRVPTCQSSHREPDVPYPFLVLSVLLLLPAALAYAARRDLRPAVRFAIPFSLPFALTEPLFYPEYWRPEFLFDLADHIGFGIEDVLFVAALAALTVTSYPVVARRTLAPIAGASTAVRSQIRRAIGLLAGIAALAAFGAVAGAPMIYGALFAMVAGSALAWAPRPDLRGPSLVGAAVTTAVYGAACLGLALWDPQLFHSVWRTRELTATFVFGVPLEELLYGAAAGLAGTVFVPFVRDEAYVPLPRSSRGTRHAASPRPR
jgi:hypothetical protein